MSKKTANVRTDFQHEMFFDFPRNRSIPFIVFLKTCKI